DPEHRGDDINGKGKARKSQSGTGLNLTNGTSRPNATRRRIAQARAEGPTLKFDDAALRSTLLRLMRDVAEAAGTSPGKLVEVVARVESYAADVRETAHIANIVTRQ